MSSFQFVEYLPYIAQSDIPLVNLISITVKKGLQILKKSVWGMTYWAP